MRTEWIMRPADRQALERRFGLADLTQLKFSPGISHGGCRHFYGVNGTSRHFIKASSDESGWISLRREYEAIQRAWEADPIHVPRPNGLFEVPGLQAISMEWLSGETLADYLAGPSRRQELDDRIAEGLFKAVDAFSRAGIVHCDLRPENIILMSDKGVRIVDFQFAVLLGRKRWPAYFLRHPERLSALGGEYAPEGGYIWDDMYSLWCILGQLTQSPSVTEIRVAVNRRIGQKRVVFPLWPRVKYFGLKMMIGIIPFRTLRKKKKERLFG